MDPEKKQHKYMRAYDILNQPKWLANESSSRNAPLRL